MEVEVGVDNRFGLGIYLMIGTKLTQGTGPPRIVYKSPSFRVACRSLLLMEVWTCRLCVYRSVSREGYRAQRLDLDWCTGGIPLWE